MLYVHTVDGEVIETPTAASWHVDEKCGLHMKSINGQPVASFAPTKWIGVVTVDGTASAKS